MTEEQDILAGELALGVLDGDDRAEAMRLKLNDPAFAEAVRHWEALLAPMAVATGPAELATAAIWQSVEPRLADRSGAIDVVQLPLRRSLARWRAGAVGSASVAAALALALMLRPDPVPLPSPVQPVQAIAVAQLIGAAEGPLLTLRYQPEGGAMIIRAEGVTAVNAYAPELWVIPQDGVPKSLGQIATSGTSRVTVPADLRALIRDGAVLAITIEPQSETPHPAPSGPPVASGHLATI